MTWAFVVADTDGTELGDLYGTTRSLTVKLDAACEASVTIDGDSSPALDVAELATDLFAWRNGTRLFRGRIGRTSDQLGRDDYQLQVDAGCYRAVLGRRIIMSDLDFTAEDQFDAAWAIVAHIQSQSGGNYGITRGSTATSGTNRTLTIPAGKNAAEALDELAKLDGGFDWWIDPNMVFHVGHRGQVKDFVLDYGGTVSEVDRSIDPSRFANAIRATGDDSLTPETPVAGSFDPTGRFDLQQGFTDIGSQSALSSAASGLLAETNAIPASYTVTLELGKWNGPDDLWVGDTCGLSVKRGRLDIDVVARVHEIKVDVGDSGEETVTVTVDGPSIDTEFDERERRILRRLTRLERRA